MKPFKSEARDSSVRMNNQAEWIASRGDCGRLSFCFVTLYDPPYGPSALHGNVLLCKKKQIITTERRTASPAACYLKSLEKWNAGRTCLPSDKPAPSAVQLPARNRRSRRTDEGTEATCPTASRNLPGKATAMGASGSRPPPFPHC